MPDVYENARFFTTLDDVGAMLAELHYIDLARPYLQGLPWNAMFDMHDVELGTRHPFMIRITVDEDPTWAEVQERLREFQSAAATRAESEPEALADTARALVRFDPAEHREAVQQLSRIHQLLLLEGTKDLGLLERSLDDWTGSAADAFALDFYQPLELVHANHCYLLGESAKGMAAAIGLVEAAQDALMNAVLAAQEVLDAQLRARSGGSDGPSSEEFLTLSAAAVAVFTIVKFAHPPIAGALSLTSLGIGLLKEFGLSDAEPARESLEAATADEVAASLHRTIGEVLGVAAGALSDLNGLMGAKRSELSAMRADRRLFAPAPGLTADTAPARFHYQFGAS